MRIIDAFWEKRNFGVDTAELILEDNDTIDSVIDAEKSLPQETRYVVLKTPVNRSELLFGLAQNNWTFVEAMETVQLKRENYHLSASLKNSQLFCSWRMVETLEEAVQVLSYYKMGTFLTDRIALDPVFGERIAGNRYYNWGMDVFHKGGEIIETLFQGKKIGSFVWQFDKKIPHLKYVILYALLPDYRGKGLGSPFLKSNLDAVFDRGITEIQTSISTNNIPSIRLWLKFGAEILNTHYVYVKHRTN